MSVHITKAFGSAKHLCTAFKITHLLCKVSAALNIEYFMIASLSLGSSLSLNHVFAIKTCCLHTAYTHTWLLWGLW